MKKIPLTQGKFAIVDAEDYERLNRHKWQAQWRFGTFYAKRKLGRSTHYMHREILNPPHGLSCDHKDHNGLNNQKSNLRLCTQGQNVRNRRPNKNSSSRYKGVTRNRRRRKSTGSWRAQIRFNGKLRHLGIFKNEVDAAVAYDRKAVELFRDFAWLNFRHRIRRRNIYRWLSATRGRLFSVTFIKRSDGGERTIVARVGATKGQKHKGLHFNPRDRKLIVVFDVSERKYKSIPVEGIEAVCCRGRRYRVD
ncbi:MAG: hypothetical protein ACYSTF_09170 [Planctomycetota bacterium]|jgi:hypothetical protein